MKKRRYAISYLLYLQNFAEGRQIRPNPHWNPKEKYSARLWWIFPCSMKKKLREMGSPLYSMDAEKHYAEHYPNEIPLMMDHVNASPFAQKYLNGMVKHGLIVLEKDGYHLTDHGKEVHKTQGFGKRTMVV